MFLYMRLVCFFLLTFLFRYCYEVMVLVLRPFIMEQKYYGGPLPAQLLDRIAIKADGRVTQLGR
jgi:hypothetical protein